MRCNYEGKHREERRQPSVWGTIYDMGKLNQWTVFSSFLQCSACCRMFDELQVKLRTSHQTTRGLVPACLRRKRTSEHPIYFLSRRRYKMERYMQTRQTLLNLAWSLVRQAQTLKRNGEIQLATDLARRSLSIKSLAWSLRPEPIPIRVPTHHTLPPRS